MLFYVNPASLTNNHFGIFDDNLSNYKLTIGYEIPIAVPKTTYVFV